MKSFLSVLVGTVLFCASNSLLAQTDKPNILFIISDDMGIETVESYGIGLDPPKTATLGELASNGVSFTNMWAQPVCSPTRATILTGRYGFRTGVGGPTGDNVARGEMPAPPAIVPANLGALPVSSAAGGGAGNGGMGAGGGGGGGGGGQGVTSARWGISLEEFTLPQAFNEVPELGYDKAAIGKWHLADTRNGWEDHPNLAGFEHFKGLVRCCPEHYYGWVDLENGEFSTRTGYAPSAKVDDAIDWLGNPSDREEPWFLWLAFNTPHSPIHIPPRELLQSDDPALDDPEAGNRPAFKAMIEAMDTEIGRLLDYIGPEELENTYVIFIGDNGTGRGVIDEPFRGSSHKGTVWNGGIMVPFIITGPGVAQGETSHALVNSTDLYSTMMEMAGINFEETVPDNIAHDSVSLMPYLSNPDRESIRDWIYVDRFNTEEGVKAGEYAIRDQKYKYLNDEGTEYFFDLEVDPYEYNNLLDGELSNAERSRFASLKAQIEDLHNSEN
jgi:arylsulfatase B